jgi:hypothetical protein
MSSPGKGKKPIRVKTIEHPCKSAMSHGSGIFSASIACMKTYWLPAVAGGMVRPPGSAANAKMSRRLRSRKTQMNLCPSIPHPHANRGRCRLPLAQGRPRSLPTKPAGENGNAIGLSSARAAIAAARPAPRPLGDRPAAPWLARWARHRARGRGPSSTDKKPPLTRRLLGGSAPLRAPNGPCGPAWQSNDASKSRVPRARLSQARKAISYRSGRGPS